MVSRTNHPSLHPHFRPDMRTKISVNVERKTNGMDYGVGNFFFCPQGKNYNLESDLKKLTYWPYTEKQWEYNNQQDAGWYCNTHSDNASVVRD